MMDTSRRSVLVKPGDSFELWHQVTCRDFSLTDCDRSRSSAFRGGIISQQFEKLMINDLSLSTAADEDIRVARKAADVRRDSRDYFMVWLVRSGQVMFAHDDQQAILRAGDIALHDQSQPFTLAFGASTRASIVSIPRVRLTSRLPDAHRLAARRISAETPANAFARSMIQQLAHWAGAVDDDVATRLSASALDVISVAIGESAGTASAHDRRLAGIKKYILANLHDPSLNVDKIANANNVTARTLSRIFAQENATPIRWLWQQRLAASHRALSDGRVEQVTEAALSFGFADLSHFSRAFKSAYGHPPHHLKRRNAND